MIPEEKKVHIRVRIAALRVEAAQKYKISPERCHIGHIVLQAMLDRPNEINQIDGVTGESETNISVASRSVRLASAMKNSGLQIEDQVVIMSHNHLDMCIPFYASHYNGHTSCTIDPVVSLSDLTSIFKYMSPKIVFCPKHRQSDVNEALGKNGLSSVRIVVFDDKTYNIEKFIENHNGTENDFKPALFDPSETTCWLMLTSGTTGLPKLAIVRYATLLDAVCSWWSQFTQKWHMTFAMGTIQWMSSLYIFISTPLMGNVRLQNSVPITPQLLVSNINKYKIIFISKGLYTYFDLLIIRKRVYLFIKPNVTAWTPNLLNQFLQAAGDFVDLSAFKYILIGGSGIDRPLYEIVSKKCPAYLYLVYGMTELLVPVFDYNTSTPFGSTGQPRSKFQYRLVDDDGTVLEKPNEAGELWIKGNDFFKGYLNNPEETEKFIAPDGWIKTGDIFYRDEDNYYYFIERKRLLIKYNFFWISPLQLEEAISKHPDVTDVCVVGLPDKVTKEKPVAAVVRRPGSNLQARDIFNQVARELPEKQVYGGVFFLEQLPNTPSGKVHRAKIKEMALTADPVLPPK